MSTEADTCRKYVVPRLQAAGWDDEPHSIAEQRSFTDGRILVVGSTVRRKPPKRADYLLRYTRDFTIAVVEAKADYKLPGDGLQQARDYAQMLGVRFAYSTNGHGIIEHDFLTGEETVRSDFPKPDELWSRLSRKEGISEPVARQLLAPAQLLSGKPPRYYQETAVNRAVQAIASGKRRVLLTMATGTGKTLVAFQVCWKLWNSGWSASGTRRRPRILYLSDRNILVDQPKDGIFAQFGPARHKIEYGEAVKSREMYFAIYQAIARDERRPGLYREYAPDFFDLVIVDECHRGSARDESNWREILDYFAPAYKLGMTATPLREDNRDTYLYFGNPIYTYSLKQGIEDGFLAPYRVHRIQTTYDAFGWRPDKDQLDRYGRAIPDNQYQTPDFERVVALRARTEAIARSISDFMLRTDPMAKTIVFCVDQEHAEEMRAALTRLNPELVRVHPDYVARITSDEGDVGRGRLSRFQDVETQAPVIATTSKLLSTGVDIPTCKNIVLVQVINSIVEFKQTIGRGTRVRDDYGKYSFNILDYTGSATRAFADPDFDGEPALVDESVIDDTGKPIEKEYKLVQRETPLPEEMVREPDVFEPPEPERRKFYVDGGQVEIAAHLVYELDAEGHQLRVVKFTDYTAEGVRSLYANSAALRRDWSVPEKRADILRRLAERGISFEELKSATSQPDADPFDLLCHVTFSAPLKTCRERAERLRRDERRFFEQYQPAARAILEELLEKYAEHGVAQFTVPDVLKLPPISEHGNVMEIAVLFGGAEKLREAVNRLQALIYAT
jgi:type I restriction enzyme R subunit